MGNKYSSNWLISTMNLRVQQNAAASEGPAGKANDPGPEDEADAEDAEFAKTHSESSYVRSSSFSLCLFIFLLLLLFLFLLHFLFFSLVYVYAHTCILLVEVVTLTRVRIYHCSRCPVEVIPRFPHPPLQSFPGYLPHLSLNLNGCRVGS